MGMTKDTQHILTDKAKQRITGLINGDNTTGAIRGMLYNNLQQWKMELFRANYKTALEENEHLPKEYDNGDAFEFMRLTQGEKDFIMGELLGINEVSDDFLLKYAEITLKKLEAVPAPSMAQERLKSDLVEALTGQPF